jgi:D-alanyl-D-alanine endopeptidase (penicillin-binding protein 7)
LLHRIFIILLFFTLLLGQQTVKAEFFTAKSWLVSDLNGTIIDGEDYDKVRPIASITKLLTVMVVMDTKPDMNQMLMLTTKIQDKLPAKNQSVSRGNLVLMAIVHSSNRAAYTLCENYPGGMPACIKAMNDKLKKLKMENSIVYEPTGLDKRNVSTARELITLTKAAAEYESIVYASRKSEIKIQVKKKWFVFRNTNPMIGHYQNIVVSKTGFINESGGCITLLLDTSVGDRIVVVLGSKNTKTRIPEAEFIYEVYKD